MIPGKVDFKCQQGATFTRTLTYKIDDTPVNLTGYTSRMQVREFHYSEDPVISLTSSSGMTLGGSAGTIIINVAASATTELIPGNYVYDLELVSNNNVYRLIEGKFLVSPEVTK